MKWLKVARFFLVLGVGMILGAYVPHSWVQAVGLDVWNLPRLQDDLAECRRHSEAMDAEAQTLTRRIAVKDRLVKELVEGKSSLEAVTDKFHAMNNDDPEIFDHLRGHYHVANDRELSALNVMAFAESYLEGEEQQRVKPAILIRLDREYDRMFPDIK